MIHDIIEMVQNINDYHTPLGKIGLTLDGVGVALSVLFYGLGLKDFVNGYFPPIILVLTAISLTTSIFFKISSEYREWKKRRKK
jgi:hypothetical protein